MYPNQWLEISWCLRVKEMIVFWLVISAVLLQVSPVNAVDQNATSQLASESLSTESSASPEMPSATTTSTPSTSTASSSLSTLCLDNGWTPPNSHSASPSPTGSTQSPVEHKGLCFEYNWKNCRNAMRRSNIPKEQLLECHGQLVSCEQQYCLLRFGRSEEWAKLAGPLANWQRGVMAAECYSPPAGSVLNNCTHSTGNFFVNNETNADLFTPDTPYHYTYCHCKGSICNNFYNETFLNSIHHPTSQLQSVAPGSTTPPLVTMTTTAAFLTDANSKFKEIHILPILSAIIALLVVAMAVLCLLYQKGIVCCKRVSSSKFQDSERELSTSANSGTNSSGYSNSSYNDNDLNTLLDLSNQTLLCHGRFGKLYLLEEYFKEHRCVVKVYKSEYRDRWLDEKTIYLQPGMRHENILLYLGAMEQNSQLFLLLNFHPKGSLHAYLKENRVSWQEMLTIMHSFMRGVAHLHSSVCLAQGSMKYPIAHRDIKSMNVLLDDNLSAKIADFNLAQIIPATKLEIDPKSRVGTVRYMAPEILNGQIAYTREAVLQTDIYSASLVLWEIFSRYELSKSPYDEYKPPYFEHVKENPTMKEMCSAVCTRGFRPQFASHTDPDMAELISTIKDGWEEDGAVRLTAQCIETRLAEIINKDEFKTSQETSFSSNNNVKCIKLSTGNSNLAYEQ